MRVEGFELDCGRSGVCLIWVFKFVACFVVSGTWGTGGDSQSQASPGLLLCYFAMQVLDDRRLVFSQVQRIPFLSVQCYAEGTAHDKAPEQLYYHALSSKLV